MEKLCPECGDRIIGRSDKRFCGDACRNAHNNSKNKDTKNLIRNTNNRLRKNYRILEALNSKDKTKVMKETLLRKGFNFDYLTGIYTTKAGARYHYVYDQGYLSLDNDYYLLVKREIAP